MKVRRARIARLTAAATLVLPLLVALPSVASAETKAELDRAQAQYDQLNRNMEVLVEEYNGAQVRLDEIRAQRTELLSVKQAAEQDEAAALRALADRASAAYMESGSQLDSLLGAGDFSDFSDRLEFINQLASQDADLAARAERAGQRAAWAVEQLQKVQAEQSALVDELASKKAAIEASLERQRALVNQLGDRLKAEQEAARRASRRAAAQAEADAGGASDATTTGGTGSTGGSGGGGGAPPPVNGRGADAAVAAAYSVLGTKYVWGGASPNGFDCSGLTMWAWARGGVSLPHNSAAQYAATPRISRSQLQPGDLVFFYSPISHVGLYIGGNKMIDAIHPGPGGEVAVRTLFPSYVGAGRPG